MIGVNTSIFKSAGRKLVNLLGTLKDRATYYENGTDSVAEKNRIDDLGILDKATILLTPTATSDARVHSVKTYTGDELVTNGGFDTDSDWSKVNSTISGGKGNLDGDGQTALLWQDILTDGKTYKATFTVSNYDGSGSARLVNNSVSITYYTITGDGTFTIYFRHSDASGNFLFYAKDGAVLSIDNVSVTEADADFDFDRASSATRINSSGLVQDMQSITDPELVLNGDFEELGDELVTNGTFDADSDWITGDAWDIEDGKAVATSGVSGKIRQTNTLNGKYVKVTLTVSDYGGTGLLLVDFGSFNSSYITSNGTHTFYGTYDQNDFEIYKSSPFTGSIDNVSVKQVDPNDRWTLGTGWSIEDGVASFNTTTNGSITQSGYANSKTYKVSIDVVSYVRGNPFIAIGQGSQYTIPTSIGTHIIYVTSGSVDTILRIYSGQFGVGGEGSIDNVSVKDITFSEDVDLARISYDSNGDNGHILLEPTSTNLVTYSEDFSQWGTSQGTPTPNYGISPDGTQNSTRYVFSGADQELRENVTTSASSTGSIYVKGTSGETIKFGVQGSESLFTLNGEWQRIQKQGTATSNRIVINTYSGATARDIELWGAQLENLSYATSYIPTLTGSTVTRAGEKLYGSGNSTLINSEEGVLYAEIAALVDDATYRFISLSDGTTGNRVVLGYHNVSNTVRGYVYSGSSIVATMSYVVDSIRDFIKLAIKYKRDDFALWVDGVKRGVDGAGAAPIGLDSLQFDSGDGSSFLYGKCKAVAVFDRALIDDELRDLTT